MPDNINNNNNKLSKEELEERIKAMEKRAQERYAWMEAMERLSELDDELGLSPGAEE
jgi:hypothetical protein